MTSTTDHESASRPSSSGSGTDQMTTNGAVDSKTQMDGSDHPTETEKKPKDPKDPSRPRRKKARRACHACQRAHLTCGDERPCQRCIKRGLAEQCCDGVRKKAKYLHDTPNEAYLPGGMSHFNYMNGARHPARSSQDVPFNLASPTTDVYSPLSPQTPGFPVFRPGTASSQVPEPAMGPQQYAPQAVAGPAPYTSPQGPQNMQTLLDAAQQSMSAEVPQPVQDNFGNQFFDANDFSKFNFDPSAFNFGNHYGALEFGMLGHMATGAAETPPSDAGTQYNQNFASPVGVSGYADSPIRGRSFSMGQDQSMPDWQPPSSDMARMDGIAEANPGLEQHRLQARSRRLPAAIPINVSHTRDGYGRLTGTLTPPATDVPPNYSVAQEALGSDSLQSSPQLSRITSLPSNDRATISNAQRRDTTNVYRIKKGYDYVQSWHTFRVNLQYCMPRDKAIHTMQSVANIRPSYIAAARPLSPEDLVFQEQCFQRTLMMYDDWTSSVCTPTIILRRTGELAAANHEFCVLTGWTRDVLLGREPNLNENYAHKRRAGGTSSGTASVNVSSTVPPSHGGSNTPKGGDPGFELAKPRTLYLAELFDEDSTVHFYDNYARIAFSEPRGRIETRVLIRKYRTKADIANSISRHKGDTSEQIHGGSDEIAQNETYIDCCCTWAIKRDCFEIPMMIIMNFLPCL